MLSSQFLEQFTDSGWLCSISLACFRIRPYILRRRRRSSCRPTPAWYSIWTLELLYRFKYPCYPVPPPWLLYQYQDELVRDAALIQQKRSRFKQCAASRITECIKVLSFSIDNGHESFSPLVYRSLVDSGLFECSLAGSRCFSWVKCVWLLAHARLHAAPNPRC